MTTLESIGFAFAGGSVVFVTALSLFGCAVRSRCIYIAPRCTARPRNVIYNPHPTHPSQKRGTPMFGWIRWTLGLTYPTMLDGVPGTGTRKGGLEGSNLTVNLDGVVLLRFHATCLRIAVIATFLCIVVILPLNWTTRCANIDEASASDPSEVVCFTNAYNLTNYERTTLANIPSLGIEANLNETKSEGESSTVSNSVWGQDVQGLLGRLYGIVLCSWIITIYACYTLRREWLDLLAMRRVYYLEPDIWEKRKRELAETLLKESEPSLDAPRISPKRRRKMQKVDPRYGRDPWIPHPEQRETVPNISLYSVLVGSLPSLPAQVVDEDDVESAIGFSKRQSIDWQLSVTTAFFDQCVPNQPGFSSSVAAVTILPSAPAIATAWKKWYAHAAALRRLRYIRRLIADLRFYDIENEDDEEEEVPQDQGLEVADDGQMEETTTFKRMTPRSVYRNSVRNAQYYKEILTSYQDEEVEDLFLVHLEFGPEQTAIYSRELAQSAAQCCPNGCGEERLRKAPIDELLELEAEALANLEHAYKELQEARDKVASRNTDPKASSAADLFDGTSTSQTMENLPDDLRMEAEALEKFTQNNQSLHVDTQVPPSALGEEHTGNPYTNALLSTRSNGHIDSAAQGIRQRGYQKSDEWEQVERIVNNGEWEGFRRVKGRHATLGAWKLPSRKDIADSIKKGSKKIWNWAFSKTTHVVDDLARESTWAVVTFTSRQAAVAARNCLADGRGQKRWLGEKHVPVPPLADAAAFDLCTCRGCCRPVTLTIPDKQKMIRRTIAVVLLAVIYIFYTIPLTFASSLANPKNLEEWFPVLKNLEDDFENVYGLLSGMIAALIWTFFFSLCPVMFKTISNFGSNATSVLAAEFRALQYFWWFMLITAFSGNLLSTMVINGLQVEQSGGITLGSELQRVLVEIAATIPTQIAASWINWIIIRFTMTLPLNYMLQINTFIFSFLGWNCCQRLVMGGGPGGPVPYRVYVDSGVAFLCLVALAPASPLVAPLVLIYFLYCQPLLRRNVIFMYRPKFDAGGVRWPFLFDAMIASMLLGQVLLCIMMGLKQAFGPSLLAAIPFVPTLMYRYSIRKRFYRAFMDAALLQTSNLDMWDLNHPTSLERREEFRRFLVDAHKASYVPVCIAGRDDGRKTLTAEPAVVIPHPNDVVLPSRSLTGDEIPDVHQADIKDELQKLLEGISHGRKDPSQFGASLRRVSMSTRSMNSRSSTPHEHLCFNDDGSVVLASRQSFASRQSSALSLPNF